jgi:hypothetical protein
VGKQHQKVSQASLTVGVAQAVENLRGQNSYARACTVNPLAQNDDWSSTTRRVSAAMRGPAVHIRSVLGVWSSGSAGRWIRSRVGTRGPGGGRYDYSLVASNRSKWDGTRSGGAQQCGVISLHQCVSHRSVPIGNKATLALIPNCYSGSVPSQATSTFPPLVEGGMVGKEAAQTASKVRRNCPQGAQAGYPADASRLEAFRSSSKVRTCPAGEIGTRARLKISSSLVSRNCESLLPTLGLHV